MTTTALPAPTGTYNVGVEHLFLTDTSRKDPFSGAASREITVNAFYPTATNSGTKANYLSQNSSYTNTMAADDSDVFDGTWEYIFNAGGTLYPTAKALVTSSYENAPILTSAGLLPVVVLGPAMGTPNGFYTTLAQDLASNGFIVLALSVTWEAASTEIATGVDGQDSANPTQTDLTARVGDMQYVINNLGTLPNGIGAQIDLTKIGVGGHSFGGYTAMEIAYADQNVKAVACLDATCGYTNTSSDPQNHGLPYAQPVLLISGDPNIENPSASTQGSWTGFQAQPHGPFCEVVVTGAAHYAMSDVCLIDPNTATFSGTIAPTRALAIIPAYTLSFLDWALRGGPGTLLSGPQSAYPEVQYLQSIA